MKSVQFALVCPSTLEAGAAVDFAFQHGVAGSATIVNTDFIGGPVYRVIFKEPFQNEHYVVISSCQLESVSATPRVFAKTAAYVDIAPISGEAGNLLEVICSGF